MKNSAPVILSTDTVPLGNDYYAITWQDGSITCENPVGDEIGQEALPAAQAEELNAYLEIAYLD